MWEKPPTSPSKGSGFPSVRVPRLHQAIAYFITMRVVAKNILTLDQVLKTYNWQDSYYDLYPGYSKPENDQECMFDNKDSALVDARDLLAMVKSFPNMIPVYRVVGVKTIKDLDLNNPGWSWSWEEKSALGFGNLNHIPKPWVMLKGYAPKKDVDWVTTLKLYHQFSGGGVSDSENEIRIQGNKVKDIKARMIK